MPGESKWSEKEKKKKDKILLIDKFTLKYFKFNFIAILTALQDKNFVGRKNW